jgi:predicted GIY-YIG superfamily endonuclease
MKKEFTVYVLECGDGSYYTGMTASLERRFSDHQNGVDPKAYTFSRRPVKLVWSQSFASEHEAFKTERQIKGWSRVKKEALIQKDWEEIHNIVKDERRRREGKKK